jgi:hypothetical protein
MFFSTDFTDWRGFAQMGMVGSVSVGKGGFLRLAVKIAHIAMD